MIQQDISISPLLLPSPNPMIHLKKSKYKIPDKFPPHIMLNAPNNHTALECINEVKEKSLDLSLSSTNSETEDDGEDVSCESVNEYRRILKKFKSNNVNEHSSESLKIILPSKKSSINQLPANDLIKERGYTILDMLELTCK